jgi:predicted O-methyltransferase YrrM
MLKTITESEIIKYVPSYDLILQIPDHDRGLILRSDLEVMLRLLIATGAKNIFEFGTWAGKTTRILSLYLDRVYTLDIPKEIAELSELPEGQIGELSSHDDIGYFHKDRDNIIQFYGDSGDRETMRKIGFCVHEKLDAVFIDGNHSRKYIVLDTVNALKMTKKGGLIMWHDVKDDEGIDVKQVLEELSFDVWHVEGTWIGFCVV